MMLGRKSVVQGGRVCETSRWTRNLRSLSILWVSTSLLQLSWLLPPSLRGSVPALWVSLEHGLVSLCRQKQLTFFKWNLQRRPGVLGKNKPNLQSSNTQNTLIMKIESQSLDGWGCHCSMHVQYPDLSMAQLNSILSDFSEIHSGVGQSHRCSADPLFYTCFLGLFSQRVSLAIFQGASCPQVNSCMTDKLLIFFLHIRTNSFWLDRVFLVQSQNHLSSFLLR